MKKKKTGKHLRLLSQTYGHGDFKFVLLLLVALSKTKRCGVEIGGFKNSWIWKTKNLKITMGQYIRLRVVHVRFLVKVIIVINFKGLAGWLEDSIPTFLWLLFPSPQCLWSYGWLQNETNWQPVKSSGVLKGLEGIVVETQKMDFWNSWQWYIWRDTTVQ